MIITLAALLGKKPFCHQQNIICRGPECMAWVETHRAERAVVVCQGNETAVEEPPRPEGVPSSWVFFPYEEADGDPAGWVETEDTASLRNRGCCGLVYPHIAQGGI